MPTTPFIYKPFPPTHLWSSLPNNTMESIQIRDFLASDDDIEDDYIPHVRTSTFRRAYLPFSYNTCPLPPRRQELYNRNSQGALDNQSESSTQLPPSQTSVTYQPSRSPPKSTSSSLYVCINKHWPYLIYTKFILTSGPP